MPRFVEATLTQINKAAPDRVTPPCRVYDECGGCQLQHLAYESQLDFKKDVVKQAMAKYKPSDYQDYTHTHTHTLLPVAAGPAGLKNSLVPTAL